MALSTAIQVTVASDWKSLLITDKTGYGITGYGATQDPAGYREASGSGTDIYFTHIILTSPSGTSYTIHLSAASAYAATLSGYTITNVALGLASDTILEEGIWTVSYTPYFSNAVTIGVTSASTTVTFGSSPLSFSGISSIATAKSTTPVYYSVSAINLTGVITLSTAYASTTNAAYSDYAVGYGSTVNFAIAKTIKDCLDAKVAAIPSSSCACKDKQINNLMLMYLTYDGMLLNGAANNEAKAESMYDVLDNFRTNSDCRCNG